MEKTAEISQCSPFEEDEVAMKSEFKDLIKTLPRMRDWNGLYSYKYQGCWLVSTAIEGMISFQQNFQARDNDVILISPPKSGTTWLMALAFSIVNRNRFPLSQTPLLTSTPRSLVPFLECLGDQNPDNNNYLDHGGDLSSPRIFATHTPCSLLPPSVKEYHSKSCRIVYICRNPLDHFISLWHFLEGNRSAGTPDQDDNDNLIKPTSLEDALEMFCKGMTVFEPFWDHVLGYWKDSKERPDKVLFLKYEDLNEDIITNIKRIADFLGFPFYQEEEKQGMIEEISNLCSFDNLKNLEHNKKGNTPWGVQNTTFFRKGKGKVGDWSNYLTPSMVNQIETVIQEKLRGSGLAFKTSVQNDY